MSIQTTYSHARANLASLLDAVDDDRDVVIIKSRGRGDVVMVSADEFESLRETQYYYDHQPMQNDFFLLYNDL